MARLAVLVMAMAAMAAAAQPSGERQRELRHLILQDCGSCHGMTLGGGLGPALTPEALADKAPELLYHSILSGRTGTAMPPWQGLLTPDEVVWIVEQLLTGIPE